MVRIMLLFIIMNYNNDYSGFRFSSLTEIIKCKEEKDSIYNSISSKNIKVKQNRADHLIERIK